MLRMSGRSMSVRCLEMFLVLVVMIMYWVYLFRCSLRCWWLCVFRLLWEYVFRCLMVYW